MVGSGVYVYGLLNVRRASSIMRTRDRISIGPGAELVLHVTREEDTWLLLTWQGMLSRYMEILLPILRFTPSMV